MHSKRTGVMTAAVGAFVLAAPLFGQVTSQNGAYLLRIKWVKDKSYSYKIVSQTAMEGSAKPFSMDAKYSLKVKSVKNNVATIDLNSTPVGANKPITDTMQVDSRGKVVSSKAKTGIEFAMLPVKNVKINETWQSEQVLPSPIGEMKVKTTYRLKGPKTVNGKQLMEIGMGVSSTGSGISGSGHGSMFIDMADGMLWSSSVKQTLSMSTGDGDPMTMPVTVTVSRS